ncbi:MAG: GTP cyclohydrolase [Sphingomonas sanxanigenens]|uniref:GTP cyclohydrolase n=1 Tax=Sphingomonas sanxanigenens TaxID=397260 RepID=A0A2W5A736_9SPHN|nr:MAG: GTP cyclohydrolase [Sphingomonas sanxanigenens]
MPTFLVTLSYKADLARMDELLGAHRAWLEEAIASGRLLVAGRKVPRTGGFLIARGERAEVEAWAATDPFAIGEAADYDFLEIAPTMVAPGLEALTRP